MAKAPASKFGKALLFTKEGRYTYAQMNKILKVKIDVLFSENRLKELFDKFGDSAMVIENNLLTFNADGFQEMPMSPELTPLMKQVLETNSFEGVQFFDQLQNPSLFEALPYRDFKSAATIAAPLTRLHWLSAADALIAGVYAYDLMTTEEGKTSALTSFSKETGVLIRLSQPTPDNEVMDKRVYDVTTNETHSFVLDYALRREEMAEKERKMQEEAAKAAEAEAETEA